MKYFKLFGISIIVFGGAGPFLGAAIFPVYLIFLPLVYIHGFPPAIFASLGYSLLLSLILGMTRYLNPPYDKTRCIVAGACLGIAFGLPAWFLGMISGGIIGAFLTPILVKQWHGEIISTGVIRVIFWPICMALFVGAMGFQFYGLANDRPRIRNAWFDAYEQYTGVHIAHDAPKHWHFKSVNGKIEEVDDSVASKPTLGNERK